MVDMDPKGFNQILLSPVFLLNHILAVIMPGALLMLLLGLKGNTTLQNAWADLPFGYKTKVAVFLLFAYFLGSVFRAFISCLFSLHKSAPIDVGPLLKAQPPEVQKMFAGAFSTGALLSTPGLIDRLSVLHAEAGFHLGTGTALLIAATVHGDGSLRWLELVLGIVMLWAGVLKGRKYHDEMLSMIGVGWANVIGRMTPQQIQIAAAIINSLKPPDAPKVVLETPPEFVGPENSA